MSPFARLRLRRPSAAGLLAWLLPVFAWAALTYPGYFELHSGFLPVYNLVDLTRNLTDLGWAPTVGQPYDLLTGERVLPYLLGLAPLALGASPVAAVKWVFAACLTLGSAGMYVWTRPRLGGWPALVAALIYLTWPVGLATTFVRGAFAEAALLALLPWVFWAAQRAASRPSGARSGIREQAGWGAALALLLAAAFWTQAGLAAWLAVMVLVYLGSTPFQAGPTLPRPPSLTGRRLGGRWLAWLAGLLLGAAGLAPVVAQHGVGAPAATPFAAHLVYPFQLLLAGGGRGPSVPGPDDALTFQLGLAAVALALFALVECWSARRSLENPPIVFPHLGLAAVLALIPTFLSTTLAAPIWRLAPALARTLTYPWQLLLLAGPWLAWLAGVGAARLLSRLPAGQEGRSAPALAAALCGVALLAVYTDPSAARPTDHLLGPPPTTLTPAAAPRAIYGDNEIALLDATPVNAPGPGARVALIVHWQALRPLEADYTAFFHVLGPGGVKLAQQDTMPGGSSLPTSRWRPGQVISDRYEAQLPADAAIGGDYRYLLGLYRWQDGQRLAAGADDKVTIQP
jgi:hypothetical protein